MFMSFTPLTVYFLFPFILVSRCFLTNPFGIGLFFGTCERGAPWLAFSSFPLAVGVWCQSRVPSVGIMACFFLLFFMRVMVKRLHQRKQTNKRNWGLNTMLFSSLISQKFHLRECCWWKLLSQTSLTPMWDTAKAKEKKGRLFTFKKS